MENSNYKKRKYWDKKLNNMRKNQFLNIKNSLLELEKDFIELKDREVKIKRDIEELLFKPTTLYIDHMNKCEQR